MRQVTATRYVMPLREGGSLPAIVEADDAGLYVLKFRGAGQGPKALIAEWIGGELARVLGLTVPELVSIELDPVLGRNEPDPEIRELIKASGGLNLALDYLPGSLTFDPVASAPIDSVTASTVVWFDAFALNVDRTAKNPNLLTWHQRLFLIDHGAALYFHHDWPSAERNIHNRFPQVRDHVLLPRANEIAALSSSLLEKLTDERVESIVAQLPDAWLIAEAGLESPSALRGAYSHWLRARRLAASEFVEEAVFARSQNI